MNSLIIDTETTGFPHWKSELDDPKQPGLLELAFQLYCHEQKETITSFSSLIDCKISIPDDVIEIHGISKEMVAQYGMPEKLALQLFDDVIQRADRIVAHNLNFDRRIMKIAFCRVGMECEKLNEIDKLCTMLKSTPMLKLPGKSGYKWPKLEEAYKILVDKDGFEKAHRASYDVEACREIMLAIEDE
ncbi:MAG: 3'-5' exonuclease [Candidatus Marinimicrobia bacterium]|nr:3'-5' exonuclease [Candidatus Neomarinimicrobiota bacterium]